MDKTQYQCLFCGIIFSDHYKKQTRKYCSRICAIEAKKTGYQNDSEKRREKQIEKRQKIAGGRKFKPVGKKRATKIS